MKIAVDDLKKALDWIRTNTHEVIVDTQIVDNQLRIKCVDKYQIMVEITVYADSLMLPKIKKEDFLR